MALNLWRPEKRRCNHNPPVVPGLPIPKYTNRELSVRLARRSENPHQDPGIAWMRAVEGANRPEKDAAREAVLSLFTREAFPGKLRILSFPASQWRFERALLSQREGDDELRKRGPSFTNINAIERDEAVFRAACHHIPTGFTRRKGKRYGRTKASPIRHISPPPFATAAVQTALVTNFTRCDFEDFATHDWTRPPQFDAAWLDFNGHLPPSRLHAIATFWHDSVRSLLVVTLLNGRTIGNPETLLATHCGGAKVESVTRYHDGAPMIQLVLRRTNGG